MQEPEFMSKEDLEQLNMLLIKFKETYKKSYPITGIVQLLLIQPDAYPAFDNSKTTKF